MKLNIHLFSFEDKESWIKGSKDFPSKFREAFEWMEEIEGSYKEELLSIYDVKFYEYDVKDEDEIMRKLERKEGLNLYVCGSHFISYPAVKKAVEEIKEEISFVQFDYHPDLRDVYEGRKLSHATMAKRIAEIGVKILQIGIGEQSIEDLHNAEKHNVKQYFETPSYEEIKDKVNEKVYLSFDGDAFKFFTHVSTPSLSKVGDEVFPLIESIIKEKEVIGMDIVEILGDRRDAMLASQFIRKVLFFIHQHKNQ